MNAYFDEVPTSASLLMQCGYRSKVCTNPRATKIDGTPHKLCEFHRRKANLNQQRLHKRKREKRAAQPAFEFDEDHLIKKEFELASEYPSKRACLSVDPVVYHSARSSIDGSINLRGFRQAETTPQVFGLQRMRSEDVDTLQWLLIDMQSLPQLESFLPNVAVCEDEDSIIV